MALCTYIFEGGLPCKLAGNHRAHSDGNGVRVPNDAFISPVPRPITKALKDLADKVKPESHAADLSDPIEPGVKLRADPHDTEVAAAASVFPHSGTQRRRVLDYFFGIYPQGDTDEGVQRALNMNPSSQRPRRGELVEGGWLEDAGLRAQTAAGVIAIVWGITENALKRFSDL